MKATLREPAVQVFGAVVLLLLSARAPLLVLGDTWFTVVMGRDVLEAGVIRTNTLTALGWGAPVINTQWLAHALSYLAISVGGVGGLALVGATTTALGLISAALFAVRRGATAGRVLIVGGFVVAAVGSQIVLRAQTFALPLLVFAVVLLSDDVLRPKGVTWLVIPLTMIWANVHGSVLVVPLLSGLALFSRLVEERRAGRPWNFHLFSRDLLLVASVTLAICVTPYGTDVLFDYEKTLGDQKLRELATEWYPLSISANPGAVLLLASVSTLLLLNGWRTKIFVLGSMIVLGLMAVFSVRHVTPFGFAALVLMPAVADQVLGNRLAFAPDNFMRRLGHLGLIATASLFVLAIPFIVRRTQPPAVADGLESRIAAAAGPKGCIFADELQADRLLFYRPDLRGRVAHDVRFGLAPVSYLSQLGSARANPNSDQSRSFLRKFDVLVLDSRWNEVLLARVQNDPTFALIGKQDVLQAFRRVAGRDATSACDMV